MRLSRYVQACALSAVGAIALSCGNAGTSPVGPGPDPPPPVATTVTLVGAGDIADCSNDGGSHAEATAKLLDAITDATVFTAGDLAYFQGSKGQFANCYDPRWGRHRRRTRPSPGNHEYETRGATPYYDYFGEAAGTAGFGYYGFDIGAWHIVSLNSNVADVPASQGSSQWIWLREDLQASRAKCQLAFWHHPRFSSGPNGNSPFMGDVWQVLMDFKVDVVVNGHDHFYERFDPQDAGALANPNGIREFVVGSGGATLYPFVTRQRNSVVQLGLYGVIKLTLHPDSYEWAFIEAGTGAVRDSGQGTCH